MTLFHSIETDLNLVDAKLFGDFFSNQRAIGKEDRSEGVVLQDFIELPKIRMEQRFPPGNEEPQSLDLFKFLQYPLNLFFGKVLMRTLSDITVTALEIASVCNLELKIPERGDWGRVRRHLSLEGGFGESDQIFGETETDEFFVVLRYRRTFSPADAEKELISVFVQVVKLIVLDV